MDQNKKFEEILLNFKKSGRYSPYADLSRAEINSVAAGLGIMFPEEYILALTAGSFYKSNFHFIRPVSVEAQPHLLAFAQWNDTMFAFNLDEKIDPRFCVYVLIGEFVEKKFDNFLDWFDMVYHTSTQPFSSG